MVVWLAVRLRQNDESFTLTSGMPLGTGVEIPTKNAAASWLVHKSLQRQSDNNVKIAYPDLIVFSVAHTELKIPLRSQPDLETFQQSSCINYRSMIETYGARVLSHDT